MSSSNSTPPPRPNLTSPTARPTTTTTHPSPFSTTSTHPTFTFPKTHSFPPLYTLQPNPTTRHAQLRKWSRIIQLYCRHHRVFRLRLPGCVALPLFSNREIRRSLGEADVREVLGWMAGEEGGMRGEWEKGDGKEKDGKDAGFWVYWKRPEDWGQGVWEWVDAVGQRGSVLTVYELLYGEGTVGQDFHEMDAELFTKALNTLVRKGKAQVFGDADSRGVKFF